MPGSLNMAPSTTERSGYETIQHAQHGESQRDGHIARGAAPRGADRRCWRRVWTAWPRARRWTRRIRVDAGWRHSGMSGRGGPGRSGGRSPGHSANGKSSSAAGGNNGGGVRRKAKKILTLQY